MCPVHRARSGTLEVNALFVISATVAGTLEFVFAGLPIGRATQVRASGKDREYPLGVPDYPDAVRLLESGIDAKSEVGRITDNENRIGLKEGPGKKEPEKHEEIDAENTYDGTNHHLPPEFKHLRLGCILRLGLLFRFYQSVSKTAPQTLFIAHQGIRPR